MNDENDQKGKDGDQIRVTATFSLGKIPAFHHPYVEGTTVGTVLTAVRAHFEAKDEPNVTWYLSAHDERQEDGKALEQVAGEEDEIAFRLIKEVTQG